MKKLFILGSGFSRAVSGEMPTIQGLGKFIWENVLDRIEGPRDTYKSLLIRDGNPTGVEELLTYLFRDMPWKTPKEMHIDQAAYITLAEAIAKYIRECEEKAFSGRIPSWARKFVGYLHTEAAQGRESVIISFNYDTIIERLSRLLRVPDDEDPPRFSPDSWLLTDAEINWPEFLKKLKTDDPVCEYLRGELSEKAQEKLAGFQPGQAPADDLRNCILKELNKLITQTSIYDPGRFTQHNHDEEVRRILSRPYTDEDLLYTNRRLIRRTFHNIILSPDRDPVYTPNLYRMPLNNLVHRTTGTYSTEVVETFRLLKLHGSTNWYFSGSDDFPGEQVFFTPVNARLPSRDYEGMQAYVHTNRIGLVPFIVPPVAEKGSFYRNRLIASMWGVFREAIDSANEVYFVGYSLPPTDLSMSLFLSSTCYSFSGTVHIVDTATGEAKQRLLDTYSSVFPVAEIDDWYCGHENAVESMVTALIS